MGAHPTWGVCGATSSNMKLVYVFGAPVHYCGSATTFGCRHVKSEHQSQFATLAAPTGRTWEDLLWFSIAWAAYKPQAARYNPGNGKHCISRMLLFASSDGSVVFSQKVYKTIYVDGGKIITSFPTSVQCRNRDVGLSGPEPVTEVR